MRGQHAEKHKDEQAENDAFVRMAGGVARADRLQEIWNMSYPKGNCGMMKGQTKEEVFRENAKKEGFTGRQVNRFLDLP